MLFPGNVRVAIRLPDARRVAKKLRQPLCACNRYPAMPSSVIRHYVYDSARQCLAVAFMSGEAYRYFAVPLRIVEGLSEAPSKGRYFQDHIRDRFAYCRDRTGRLYEALCRRDPNLS